MNQDLHDGMEVVYTPHPTDKEGNAAPIEAGSLAGASANEGLAIVRQGKDDDGNEALIVSSVAGAGLGPVDITVTADADLGEGQRTITETHTITIIAGDADLLGGTFGAERDRTTP